MTKTVKFAESFWEEDYVGTNGFEILCRQMKDGRSMCRSIEEYFKQRAKVEAQYSKSLQGLFRNEDDQNEIGSLRHAWQEVKSQTTRQAQLHEEARMMFQRLADDVLKFTEEQKQNVKSLEDKVKKSHGNKKTLHSRSMDLQRSYKQKCREMDQAFDQLDQTKNCVTMTQRDVEKITAKADRSKDHMEQADAAYKNSLEHLERARVTWIADMQELCEGFQQFEESRIVYIREELWEGTNVDSQAAMEHDGTSEEIRRRLEICDPDNDITEFVDRYKTGNKPPGKIIYRNYFEDKSPRAGQLNSKNRETISNRPQQPPPDFRDQSHTLAPHAYRSNGQRHRHAKQ